MAYTPGGPQPAAQPGAPAPMSAPMAPGPAPGPAPVEAPVPPMGMPPMMPMAPPPPPMFHDIKIKRTRKTERAVVTPVPPSEFGISSISRSLHDCGYCYHEVLRRESELINEGYDKAQIKKLPSFTGATNTSEEDARDTVDEHQGGGTDGGLNKANREIRITEHYLVMDYEGNGKSCMYKIVTGGDAPSEILSREDQDDVMKWEGPPPFAAGCPFPMPHRFFGRSIADLVMDIQRINTALIRGQLNNIYMRTNQRTEVAESNASVNTLDDLLTMRPNGVVRTKTPGGIIPIQTPEVNVLPALQYMDARREWRSGATRQGQGVDADALQNQVATIANQMEDASQAKVKMIARILAETGIRDMFSLLHATIRRHGSIKQTVELRGKWVTVDPRDWKTRNQMTINIGLGSGSKASLLAQVQMLMGIQEKAVAIGLVSKTRFYNSARDMVRLIKPGGDVNAYFVDPSAPPDQRDPPLQPQPDPKMMEVQSKVQIEQGKQQNAGQQFQMKMALEDKQSQADSASARLKQEGEAQLAQQKFAFEQKMAMDAAALQERKLIAEAQLKERHMAFEERMREREMAHKLMLNEREMEQSIRQKNMEFQLQAREDARKAMLEEATAKAATATRTKKVVRKNGQIDSITETIDEKGN